MKSRVYSWRLSEDLKSDLEREARERKLSVSSLLEQAARELLEGLARGHEGAWQTREAKASLERMANRPAP